MPAYYNEIDPYAAQWLRNLIQAGHIAPGDVDERDIRDVSPTDLDGYSQCHFFAGLGGWSCALRRAGWPDDKPVWTASCPCQPFSSAGRGIGFADERHLWPYCHYLVAHRKPVVCFGEQVASKDGLAWLDLVQADMEGEGYTFWAGDLCAAGFGAPHIRQRTWWVADSLNQRREGNADWSTKDGGGLSTRRSEVSRLAYTSGQRVRAHECGSDAGTQGRTESTRAQRQWVRSDAGDDMPHGGLADATEQRQFGRWSGESCNAGNKTRGESKRLCDAGRPGPTNGLWRDADWLYCRDGKWRPVEPGTFPLAHGATARVGRLRAYGNAINTEAAAGFIRSYMEVISGAEDLV